MRAIANEGRQALRFITAIVSALAACAVLAQPPGRGAAPAADLPESPTPVALPDVAGPIAGPGPMFDSAGAQWPGRDMAHFDYVADEYFVSGTAAGAPYTTRVVVRRPADVGRFSGLVVAEAMHPAAAAAHAFEYNSVYIMDSGHIAVEIATAGVQVFSGFNAERYADVAVQPNQANEILAQVGALIKSDAGPLAGLGVRKAVLWGTSASSFILTQYLPANAVYRTPDMQRIYDGFLPTSNGSRIEPVDVPMIQVPTQHEYESIATAQQDGDAPGSQFRVYEFVGIGHLDSRNTRHRLDQDDCVHPLSTIPVEAYMSVALHHLLRWVDEGVVPPRADRVLIDRNVDNDGSLMVLDAHGNPKGGIRTPYVDVPVAKYTAVNEPTPAAQGQGRFGPALLCRLSAWTTPMSAEALEALYGNQRRYVREFEARLDELEAAGWSLPVYHDLILGDAEAVEF